MDCLSSFVSFYLTEAVASARESNAEELQSLQNKLKDIEENIEYLEKKHKDFEQDNSVLQFVIQFNSYFYLTAAKTAGIVFTHDLWLGGQCRCVASWCDLYSTFNLAVVTFNFKILFGLYGRSHKV